MGFKKSLKKAVKAVKKNPVQAIVDPGMLVAREMDKGFTKSVSSATGGKYDQFLPPSGSFLPDYNNLNVWRQLQGVVAPAAKQYAPVVGGMVGNIWGPAGSAAGTYAGSKVAGQHGAKPVLNAALAYAASSAARNYGTGSRTAATGSTPSNASDLAGFANEGWIPAAGQGAASTTSSTAGGGFSFNNLLDAYGKSSSIMPANTGTGGGVASSGGAWYTNPLVINSLASLASGYMGADASKQAAKEQKAAEDAAIANYWQQYYAAQEANAPWRDTGVNALSKLNMDTSRFSRPFTIEDFKANVDPGYELRFAEGLKARERSAAARGDLFSGAQQKALEEYGQEFAANEYQNAWNRYVGRQNQEFNQLANLAGIGQSATKDLTQVGGNTATNVGNALITGGQAQAAGKVGAAQAWSDALQNAAGDYLWWKGRDTPNALLAQYMQPWLKQKGAA